MKKKLPITEPYIRCFPHHANLLATIGNNSYDNILFDYYYLQLVYNAEIHRLDFNQGLDILKFYKNYPLVDKYTYSRKIVEERWESFSRFAIDCIDKNGYIVLLVDKYYIPLYVNTYQKEHYPHDMMIYGYDDECKKLYVADCFDDGIYNFGEITFEEFDNSVFTETEYDWLDGIHVWEEKERVYLAIDYDLNIIKCFLKEYLEGIQSDTYTFEETYRRDEHERNRGKIYYYGINIYDILLEHYDMYINNNENIDIRWIYVILEHKKYMLRLCYNLNTYNSLCNIDIHEQNLQKLIDSFRIIKDLVIKYNITKRENIYKKIKDMFWDLKTYEKQILSDFLNDIFVGKYDMCSSEKECLINNLISIDATNDGDWIELYGRLGYDIVGDVRKLPDFIEKNSYIIKNAIYVSVLKNGGNNYALHRVQDILRRPVAYLLHKDRFSICMNIIGNEHKITIYCVDYDKLGREMIVEVIQNKSIIGRHVLSNFEKGIYLSFNVSGKIEIRFSKTAGPDAVVSGVFFD